MLDKNKTRTYKNERQTSEIGNAYIRKRPDGVRGAGRVWRGDPYLDGRAVATRMILCMGGVKAVGPPALRCHIVVAAKDTP